MSAHVVSDKTINRVVTFLMSPGEDIDSPLDDAQFMSPSGRRFSAAKFGQAMRDLNVASVSYRYGDDPDMLPEAEYEFEHQSVDRVQVLKSLGCWLYQCNEGDFNKDPLYKRMWKFRTELAMDIVCDSKEYESAEWG